MFLRVRKSHFLSLSRASLLVFESSFKHSSICVWNASESLQLMRLVREKDSLRKTEA
jgi:hypothetical protein